MKTSLTFVAGAILALGSSAFAQEPKESPADIEKTRLLVRDDNVTGAPVSQIDREIALVRLAELDNQIDLAKLAYKKSSSEKVRHYASNLEAVYTASRNQLERLAKTPPAVVVRAEKIAVPPREEPKPRATTGKPDPGATPRKDSGSSDPSIGSKPDAGSLDEYNRNTTNPKADSAEDRGQLKRALEDQSTPTVLDKRRDVERPAKDDSTAIVREPLRADQWVLIQQKVAAQRLKNARRALAEKEGPEFDDCYLKMQIAAYQNMIDADQVYATYVSSEGRKAIADDLKRAAEYMQEAKTLLQ